MSKIDYNNTPIDELFETVIEPEHSQKVLEELRIKYGISEKDFSYILFHARLCFISENVD